ncbi:MAG: ABC transporter permease, partial [Chloroflexota bacterium]|nr:ABC transporter permease [Chloroflexota bacterium]
QSSGRTPAESAIASFVSIIGIVLIYITLQLYGSAVASGVAEEKGSRIMELLINAATPFQLLMGKIIGIGLAGFTQIGLLGLVGAAAFLAQNPIKNALLGGNSSGPTLDFTNVSLDILGLVVIYFVLGFFLYATLYAAAGTLVSRQEEVGTSVAPLNFLIIAGYLAGFYTAFSPNATWVKVLSYIPFFTPMVMLGREGAAPLGWWEILLSCMIMVASILICAWIAARIYRVGVLMYGQKPGFGPYLKQLRGRGK